MAHNIFARTARLTFVSLAALVLLVGVFLVLDSTELPNTAQRPGNREPAASVPQTPTNPAPGSMNDPK